ncbi:MAG: putative DNA-binding domain-containing protein [Planctomycetes bacterium]|nr:putative DNA-binding domain-containing protein [Planctomycetota bacterium]
MPSIANHLPPVPPESEPRTRYSTGATSFLVLVPDAYGDALDELATGDMAPDFLRDVVLPHRLLSSADCLEVYREMFRDRVEQLLALRMPAVHELTGPERFHALVVEYVATHPAGSEDLARVGEAFPRFLASARELEPAHRTWIAELARLECAITRCAAARPAKELDEEELAQFTLLDWEFARFEPAPGLELLAFDHAVDDAYSRWLHEGALRVPRRRPQYVAVLRQGSQVQRAPMTRRAWNLLRALCDGRALATAVVDEFEPVERSAVERRVRTWLHAWITNGFFQTVHAS